MIIQPITSFLIINSVKDNYKHKEILLNLIEKIDKNEMKNSDDNITNSDWNLPKETEREYMKYFLEHVVNEPMNKMTKHFKSENWNIPNVWFQQYYKSDYHDWHLHAYCQFTNVYFIELPNNEDKTEIFDLLTNKTVEYVDIKEGDILTIPSNFIHRSKAINTNKRKTVISFNSNIDSVNPQLVN